MDDERVVRQEYVESDDVPTRLRPWGDETRSDVATRDNKPCVGVQEGGCDGAWRNKTTARTFQ